MSAAQTDSRTVTIDNQCCAFEPGQTVLQVADAHGIAIPRLCAHPAIEPFGGCRLCVVEVEGVRGYPTACTLQATAGAVIHTRTESVQALRRTTLALLLSKHPTGCLMCLHAGECIDHHGCHARRSGAITGCRFCPNDQQCELQDVVKLVGLDEMPLPVEYRGQPIDRRNPFIDIDPNLCILCGRCTRACQELRGAAAIELQARGEHTVVATSGDVPRLETTCQFCGTCLDVCPTGSLSERVNKWVGRPAATVETTCGLCSLGCAVTLGTLDGQIIGARPTGRAQLCAKGRFAPVELAWAETRVTTPLVRRNGRLVPVSWDEATALAAACLTSSRVGVWASRDLLTGDLQAVAEYAKRFGPPAPVDSDARDDLPDATCGSLDEIAAAGLLVVVDAHLQYTHTPVQTAIVQAVRQGAALVTVGSGAHDLSRFAQLASPHLPTVAQLGDLRPADSSAVVVYGAGLPSAERPAVVALAEALGASVLPLRLGANSATARQAGLVGDRPFATWFEGADAVEALVSLGCPPLTQRPPVGFWLLWTQCVGPVAEQADLILPATVYGEQDGQLCDVFGREHQLRAAVAAAGEARSAAAACAALAAAAAGERPEGWPTLAEQAEPAGPAGPSAFSYLGQPLSLQVPGLAALAERGDVSGPAD